LLPNEESVVIVEQVRHDSHRSTLHNTHNQQHKSQDFPARLPLLLSPHNNHGISHNGNQLNHGSETHQEAHAPPHRAENEPDIIDEALDYFKANVLFRNYEVKGPADRVLIYLTLYISACIQKLPNQAKTNADKALFQLAIENFSLPGDKNFALGGIVTNPANRTETDTMRAYLTQLRQECGVRLVQRVYAFDETLPNKWWMCFLKRKFLNKTLT